MPSDRAAWVSFLVYGVLGLSFILSPVLASAHEVYVLSPEQIATGLAANSPNTFDAFFTNQFQFFFWAFLGFVVVTTVFFMSITHRLEEVFRPLLLRLKPYAAVVARVTLGMCLLACGFYASFFGPELPFSAVGPWAPMIAAAFYAAGAAILFNILLVPASILALALFAVSLWQWGWYPLVTYANYVGEMLLVLLLALGIKRLEPYAFLFLRIGFGLSLIGASVYAKFIHSDLALQVVTEFNLTQYFPFDPLFIVLGAGIIEFVAGVFVIVGFEIRHTALFLLFWLTLSLLYFQESVWPHLVIAGVLIALFMRGYDRYTFEGRFLGTHREPFL